MIIYKTTNMINNKFYVGKEKDNNPDYLGSGKYFKHALKKYGKENFRKDILQHCKNIKELNERERFWIALTRAKVLGYNIADGGEGGILGNFHREAIIKSNQTRIISQETRNKIGAKSKARLSNKENHPMYGKHFSEESKDKMRKSASGKTASLETKNKMSLAQNKRFQNKEERMKLSMPGSKNPSAKAIVVNDVLYGTIKEACETLNITRYTVLKIGILK